MRAGAPGGRGGGGCGRSWRRGERRVHCMPDRRGPGARRRTARRARRRFEAGQARLAVAAPAATMQVQGGVHNARRPEDKSPILQVRAGQAVQVRMLRATSAASARPAPRKGVPRAGHLAAALADARRVRRRDRGRRVWITLEATCTTCWRPSTSRQTATAIHANRASRRNILRWQCRVGKRIDRLGARRYTPVAVNEAFLVYDAKKGKKHWSHVGKRVMQTYIGSHEGGAALRLCEGRAAPV